MMPNPNPGSHRHLWIIIAVIALFGTSCDNGFLKGVVEGKVSPPVIFEFNIDFDSAYTQTQTVVLYSRVEDGFYMRFQNEGEDWHDWVPYAPVYENWTLTPGDSVKTVYAEYRDEGEHVVSGSDAIELDSTASGAPIVSGPSLTNNPKPTWTWVSGGGNGTFRISLDIYLFPAGTPETTAMSFMPSTGLPSGNHVLYVQERDLAGNWSLCGNWGVVVDLDPPSAPVPSVPNPTDDTTPTWVWPQVSSAVTYRINLDGGGWTDIGDVLSYTPATPLTVGSHSLEVQARDAAGNWSASGSAGTLIAIPPPAAPMVFTPGKNPTCDTGPIWVWNAPAGATHYRWSWDDSTWTDSGAKQAYAASALSPGNYTLYVQAGDDVGNWSESGYLTITVVIPGIWVTNGNDSGAGSLRQAILDAATDGTIGFSGVSVVTLLSGLTIDKNLKFYGGEASLVTVESNGASFSIFTVNTGVTAEWNGIRIRNGYQSGTGRGAAIVNNGTVYLTACSLENNGAYNAGAIDNRGPMWIDRCTFKNNYTTGNSGAALINYDVMTIINSTFADNSATGTNRVGGAIGQFDPGTVTPVLNIVNCTFTNNTATGSGGAIYITTGTILNLKNCIVAMNTAPTGPDIFGPAVSKDYNLIGDTSGATITGTVDHDLYGVDPFLQALGWNGGITETCAISALSPAIDSASDTDINGNTVGTDQTKSLRPSGTGNDMGAFEY
ncbi:MAG: hypothetical protein JW969_17995 [Spirochaetales bacterium]|nr:hypothetical protein [Spirochaetales bacterium]